MIYIKILLININFIVIIQMPKVTLVCEIEHENEKIEFVRNVIIDTKDLTTFYYAIRAYFRRNLSESEKEQLLTQIKDKEISRKIKRRKNVNLRDIFPMDYYVEGVDRIGTNRYKLLWGV